MFPEVPNRTHPLSLLPVTMLAIPLLVRISPMVGAPKKALRPEPPVRIPLSMAVSMLFMPPGPGLTYGVKKQ